MTGSTPPETVTQVAQLLWPGSDVTVGRRATADRAPATRELVIAPSTARPRLLLPPRPDQSRSALAAFAGGRRGATRRLGERILAAASSDILPTSRVRAAGNGSPHADDLLDHIGAMLDERPAYIAVRLGSDRPNRKPVVAIGTADGPIIAFAKLGWGLLSDHLVAHEAQVLAPGGPTSTLTGVVAPRLVGSDAWHGHAVVVLEALETADDATAAPSRDVLVTAMLDVAGTLGSTTFGVWADQVLHPRLAGVPEPGRTAIAAALDRSLPRLGALPVRVGNWHGDFRPWNMATGGDGRLRVWDWERHSPDALLGVDAVHLHFPIPPQRPDHLSAWLEEVDVAAARSLRLLAPLGLDRDHTAAVRIAHTLELLLREHEDVAVQSDVARPTQGIALQLLLDHLVGAP